MFYHLVNKKSTRTRIECEKKIRSIWGRLILSLKTLAYNNTLQTSIFTLLWNLNDFYLRFEFTVQKHEWMITHHTWNEYQALAIITVHIMINNNTIKMFMIALVRCYILSVVCIITLTNSIHLYVPGDSFDISHSLFQKLLTLLKMFFLHNFKSFTHNIFLIIYFFKLQHIYLIAYCKVEYFLEYFDVLKMNFGWVLYIG